MKRFNKFLLGEIDLEGKNVLKEEVKESPMKQVETQEKL